MAFIDEFKAFIARGNVVDMAVGVIIGGAFGKIVSSLTEDVIMPPIGVLLGKVDFSNLFFPLINDPAKYADPTSVAHSMVNLMSLPIDKVRGMGIPVVAYGLFINQIINFLIIALCVFLLVKGVNRLVAKTIPAPEPEPEVPTTRECPECLSMIPRKAKRCCHCTAVVEPIVDEKKAED